MTGQGRCFSAGLDVRVPAVPLAVTRHALAPHQLREALLFGGLYSPADAQARGLVDAIAPADEVVTRACAWARSIASDSLATYAAVKAHLLEPTLAAYAPTREHVTREFLDVWFSEGGRRRRADARDRLLRRS